MRMFQKDMREKNIKSKHGWDLSIGSVYEFLISQTELRKVFRTLDRLPMSLRANLKSDKRIFFEELDAMSMQNFDDLSETFRHRFKFGEHYGENWDALIDCMEDVPIEKYDCALIFIQNTKHLMANERQKLETAVRVFGHISEDWGTPIEQGEWWDRPAIPVVFVLQEPDKKDRFALPLIKFG